MSGPNPTNTLPPPITSAAAVVTTSPLPPASALAAKMKPVAQMTPNQVAAAIGELTRSVAAIQSYLAGAPPPLWLPPSQPAVTTLPAVLPYGMPYSSTTGVPIHPLRMPPSPSSIPS